MSQTSKNVASNSNAPIPSRSNVLEARAEIVEERGEANGTLVESQAALENANSVSNTATNRTEKKSWWRRIFRYRRKKKSKQNQFSTRHGHITDILFMPLDLARVVAESFTGGSPNAHGASGKPTEKES